VQEAVGEGTSRSVVVKENGVYIITGGMGGLGAIFAKHLSQKYRANIVLCDVRTLAPEGEALLAEIESLGGNAQHVRCDVTKPEDVKRLVRKTKKAFGRIDGIIHAAGLTRDSLVGKKQRDEMMLVLDAKAHGALNLDAETADEEMDFFILFSSIAGVMGNVGQSDYAFANRFLDKFSEWRETLRLAGRRKGRTVSIAWPLWASGGMAVSAETKQWLKQMLGMEVLPTAEGIAAFERALSAGWNQVLVAHGETGTMREKLGVAEDESESQSDMSVETYTPGEEPVLPRLVHHDVIKIVAGIVKVSENDIDIDAEMSEYGFDSITITEFTNKVNAKYGTSLTPASFYEHGSISSMVKYLLMEYGTLLTTFFHGHDSEKAVPRVVEPVVKRDSIQKALGRFRQAAARTIEPPVSDEAIAVVGLSGAFPASRNMGDFWKHLEQCDDVIAEVPPDRWNWREYFGDPHAQANRTLCKWGGFMQDVDKFDASFFNISPHEAELMDPQQRLFLETVWHTIENAGYAPSSLSGSRTGLFVGVSTHNYCELLQQAGAIGVAHASTGTMHSVLANRISYLLNLHGPSEPIDTACSSSLIAIHRAVRSIQEGDCEMAIAGGVSVILTPTLHISFDDAGMLSEDGRCKTFDKRANGYVRGEGVGAVFLKPLSKALRDGDHIYGVIRASAENHGGHVSSLTVPNPVAQAELLVDAYSRAGIEPWRVGYVECHGTGTSLGDPVEVNGLKRAFAELYRKRGKEFSGDPYCGLGTVKTNVGHLEAAAGIAGFLKVLLAIQHKKLPGVVHFEELNPYIKIEGSPFYIVNGTRVWERSRDAFGREMPLVSGVSSFGFGGANAHIVVEEYRSEERPQQLGPDVLNVFVLSARSKERLMVCAGQLMESLVLPDAQLRDPFNARDIAYTLQVGRDAMNERLAIVASSVEELKEKLGKFVAGETGVDGVHCGNTRGVEDREGLIGKNDDDLHYIRELFAHGNFNKLAALWVNGSEVDWEVLSEGQEPRPHRISLPTYPFKRDRFWVPDEGSVLIGSSGSSHLHDLLDSNESTLEEQRYRKVLTGSEYYLRDHVVGGEKVLPGVAYLEMARLAGERAADNAKVIRIRDIIWQQPVQVSSGRIEVYVSLYPGDGFVDYEVSSSAGHGAERVVNSRGKLEYESPRQDDVVGYVDMEGVRSRCTKKKDKESVYRLSSSMGLQYGPSFQAIKELVYSDSEVLAELQLPESLKGEFEKYVLHPSLMDGALQSTLSMVETPGSHKIFVPFCMGEVEIVRPLISRCYVYGRSKDSGTGGARKFDIDLLDEKGSPLVQMRGFVVREFSAERVTSARKEERPAYLCEEWTEAPLSVAQNALSGDVVIVGGQEELLSDVRRAGGGAQRLLCVGYGESYRKLENGSYEVKPGCAADYQRVVEDLSGEGVHPASIIFFFGGDQFGTEGSIDVAMEGHFYSVFEMTKALMTTKLDDGVKILCVHRGVGVNPYVGGLSGFGRSARLENSKFSFRLVSAGLDVPGDHLAGMLLDELGSWDAKDVEIKYKGGKRYTRMLKEVAFDEANSAQPILKQGGIYLITGGMGGLGAIFARYLASTFQAKLVLSDLRELDARGEALIQDIEHVGGEAVFVRCDVTNGEQVHDLVNKAQERFGRIHGVIHAAGAIRDAFIVKKKREEMEIVLNAKIRGAIHLDVATADADLDFFITFASIAGVMGNIGQCDYAYANRFLDAFCEWREGMCARGERRGRTLSIDWPLWAEGGMMVDDEVKKRLKEKFGLNLLRTASGIAAFTDLIASRSGNAVVLDGDVRKIMQSLGLAIPAGMQNAGTPFVSNGAGAMKTEVVAEFTEKVEGDITSLCGELLGVQPENLDPEVDFSEYGVDSIMMIKMLNSIESRYEKTVDPNAITTHPTIRSFAQYLIEEGVVSSPRNIAENMSEKFVRPAQLAMEPAVKVEKRGRRFSGRISSLSAEENHRIAVIGMACRFPGSPSVDTFWHHLRAKDELVIEVPRTRWNAEAYFSPDRSVPGKSYSKWGGFIEDIDAFDAAYFNVSDEDAITMDPQQRIMLELTQELLNRSGYTKDEMNGSKTSVFIGAASNQYIHSNLDKLTDGGMKHMIVGNIPNMIAARISDYYNLHGPSQTIDTACSSSLVALSEACQSLRAGKSNAAIVGGVMLLIDPYFHVGFGKAEVLSPDGKSYVFDQRANGFVLGEGAGLVLLKPYEKALEDGDQILGVILGSAVNNDGHTMGVTVPSQDGQKEVINAAIKDSGVSPATITYLEAHGTGTLLGDPIEIKAAADVYREYTKELQFCAVGSVKSNIGHLLTAAGVASLIKVLLSLQHGELLPTLNCEIPHPRFRFPETPFYPITEGAVWEPKNGVRRAGISSFGFGGTNCHVILEGFKKDEAFGYQVRRVPLPITQFHRKRYWLGRMIETVEISNHAQLEARFVEDVIARVRSGEISPQRAQELIEM
jgi:polyketide synthase PksN